MKLVNLILAMATMVAILFINANAQQDGWVRVQSTMTYDTLFIGDSAAAQGIYFVSTKFFDSSTSSHVIWSKGGFDLPFQGILKLYVRSAEFHSGVNTLVKVFLHHKDTTISNDFTIVDEGGSWATYTWGLGAWSGTLSGFDSLSIEERYHPLSTSLAEQIIDFDNFRVVLDGQDYMFYSAGDWGNIQGVVYNDSSCNGQQEPEEIGLVGLTVCAVKGETVDSTVTDSLGRYAFYKLPIGQYEVRQ